MIASTQTPRERLPDHAVDDLCREPGRIAHDAARRVALLANYQVMMSAGASLLISTAANVMAHGCPEHVARQYLDTTFRKVRDDLDEAAARAAAAYARAKEAAQ